jgi:hypothetical protein
MMGRERYSEQMQQQMVDEAAVEREGSILAGARAAVAVDDTNSSRRSVQVHTTARRTEIVHAKEMAVD